MKIWTAVARRRRAVYPKGVRAALCAWFCLLAAGAFAQADLPPAPPGRDGIFLETLLGVGVLAGLALLGYGLGIGGNPLDFNFKKRGTAVIKCPGCGKKLRVPKKNKRVRVRCPACGEHSAYTPGKGKA